MTQSLTDDGRIDRTGDLQPLDLVLDALSHPYRRRVLLLVGDHTSSDDELEVEAIATEDDDPGPLGTELHHVHLPKLDELGYIEREEASGTIRKGPAFEEIASLLRLLDDHRDELPGGWP